MKTNFTTVDYLKFIATILIIFDHSFTAIVYSNLAINWIFWIVGAVGVGLFTYSAGFLASKTEEPFNFKLYILKKFLKLYPLAILLSLLMLVDPSSSPPSFISLFASFWFVPFIMFCYVLYAINRAYPKLFFLIIAFFISSVISYNILFSNTVTLLVQHTETVPLVMVFLVGMKTLTLKQVLPSNIVVNFVSKQSYLIYLMQSPFIFIAQQRGILTTVTYLSMASLSYFLVQNKIQKIMAAEKRS